MNKYEVFKYICTKLEELWKKLEPERSGEFTNVRLMKSLFFITLLDEKNNLHKIFNSFVAYKKGPVEEDIYWKYLKSSTWVQDQSIQDSESKNSESETVSTEGIVDPIFEKCNTILEVLMKVSDSDLSDISHESPEWYRARYFEANHKMEFDRAEEEKVFRDTLKNWHIID